MADGDSTNVSEVIGTIADAVFKPVGEEVGRMIEEGKNSVVRSDDPQSQAKKIQEAQEKQKGDADKIANYKNFFTSLAQEEQKARQAIELRDQQRAVAQQQDENKEVVQKNEETKKEEEMNVAVYNAERSKEQRNGVGG